MKNTAAGFHRLLPFIGILNLHTIVCTVTQSVDNLLPQPGQVNHNLFKTGCRQIVQMVFNQPLFADFN